MKDYLIYAVGFTAQILFFARTIVQWFKSEHEGKVLSPTIFWKISLLASILMLVYGILRNDAAILIGQILVYFIYIRNIQLKNDWKSMSIVTRMVILVSPVAILGYLFFGTDYSLATFFKNENNPLLLMIWGITAQIIFISRFFYQWIYSENRKESILPLGFWIISICGSSMNFLYGMFRLDPVLVAAHSLGMFVYLRNILIHYNKRSLFSRLNIPVLNKLIAFISGKIK
ncbi:lipid-A-disaccharide synthase N-terminal domain-containing protein [Sunxiuqinia elliptica]|uniref:Lipid A biosynthesis-like protein n=1 Tax=Sunxiuqinia elliptica TaxID=655355 RepID=A0A4R6H9E9_9BACT|nr:lipid-A-disaccharide synthase N-terminal domain-containing protein [Sunxiuqinia elliptica]TDO04930.1 lipid A biosynthesis-like protein [Sunxiuqinia elliptica]TDO64478.1 lipid A biosynthesis-like protein [Sunxiuqinia elliptica]